jgi:hypothetical protein
LAALLHPTGEAQEAFRGRLIQEVIAGSHAAPGETVQFRVTVSGGRPDAAVTIYEQLGSQLSLDVKPRPRRDFTSSCVISALPVANLSGADPGAPARNRLACPVVTDRQGGATLVLDAQVASPLPDSASEATARSVVVVIEGSTGRIVETASAQIDVAR